MHDDGSGRAARTDSAGSGGRVEGLDGLRAIAALMVLVYHVAGDSRILRSNEPGAHVLDNFGNFGVAVFFVLSGFVIYRPFAASGLAARKPPSVTSFYVRRAFRILPAYWIALFAWAISATEEARQPGTVVGKLLLTDLYGSQAVWLTGLTISWTLAIEIAFYIVLPGYALAVGWLARRASPDRRFAVHLAGLACLYVSAFVYRLLGAHLIESRPSRWSLFPNFTDWFALGMLLAVVSAWTAEDHTLPTSLKAFAQRKAASWTCAAACFLSVVILKGDDLWLNSAESTSQMSWRMFFQGFAAFFLVLPFAVGPLDHSTLLRTRAMTYLGTISYGIYLWHRIVQIWVGHLGSDLSTRGQMLVQLALVLPITVGIAAVSYRLVERPFIDLANKLTRPHRLRENDSRQLVPV